MTAHFYLPMKIAPPKVEPTVAEENQLGWCLVWYYYTLLDFV